MDMPVFDDYCFACGARNPIGLRMQVNYVENTLAAESQLALPKEFQGWQEVIHGGILATLLDEIMMHAVWHFAGAGVTLGIDVKFRQPLAPAETILVRGRINRDQGSPVEGSGRDYSTGGQPTHRQQSGAFFIVKRE